MTFIVAEIGQAHDGSLGILHSYIDAVAKTGVNAIKFQTHIAEAESSAFEEFRVAFSFEDASRFDYWKRMSFSLEQWREIKMHCDDLGIEFMSTPFSNLAVDWLEQIGVKRYKVGSGDTSNFLLLDKIAQTGKPLILSSGMSSFEELDRSVEHLKGRVEDLSILQCTTQYPTSFDRVGLNVIADIKKRYGVKSGLSDHSGSINPSLAAAALGADILEVHAVFDRRMFGPDSTSSLEIEQLTVLVNSVRNIEEMLSNPVDKSSLKTEKRIKSMFGKSLCVNKALRKGHKLTFDDLEGKKPSGHGVNAEEYKGLLGRALKRDMEQWEFIAIGDYE